MIEKYSLYSKIEKMGQQQDYNFKDNYSMKSQNVILPRIQSKNQEILQQSQPQGHEWFIKKRNRKGYNELQIISERKRMLNINDQNSNLQEISKTDSLIVKSLRMPKKFNDEPVKKQQESSSFNNLQNILNEFIRYQDDTTPPILQYLSPHSPLYGNLKINDIMNISIISPS